jgi:hypothetical protein
VQDAEVVESCGALKVGLHWNPKIILKIRHHFSDFLLFRMWLQWAQAFATV